MIKNLVEESYDYIAATCKSCMHGICSMYAKDDHGLHGKRQHF